MLPLGFVLSPSELLPPITVDGFFLSTTGVGAGFLASGWVGPCFLSAGVVPGLLGS